MKNYVTILLFFVFASPSSAQDFRKISWGMSVEQVKEIEGKELLDENEHLFVYKVSVEGMDALLFYKHESNKVIRGGYAFQNNYINKNAYIEDFQALKDLLTDQYGGPVNDEVLWKNPKYSVDVDSYGLAVGEGNLVYLAGWDAGTTKIELALHGNNSRHFLAMNYASRAYLAIGNASEQDD